MQGVTAGSRRPHQSFYTPEQLEWLLAEGKKRIDPRTNTMRTGGYQELSDLFTERFGLHKTAKALQDRFLTLLNRGETREYTAADIAAILRGVNKMLVAEGRLPVQKLTIDAAQDFLTGRRMPDGSIWATVSFAFA